MAHDSAANSISVTVRVRPFTIREAAQLTKCDDGPLFLGDGSLAGAPTPKLMQKGIRSVIKVIDEKCLVFDPPEDNPVQRFTRTMLGPQGKRVKDQTFAFDRVFDDNATQADVFEATTKSLLDSVLQGYNATVFAYGATGCGKTHTITGTAQQPGIIFMTMQELFEKISDMQEEKVTEITLSYLEIYNEMIRDLLEPGGSKQGLMLREDANQTVSVSGLSSHRPENVHEVMEMIVRGNEYRTMSPTEANATSSRSHAVLQINVSQRDRNADISEPHTMATLSIIDLAGSERASATKNRGERLIEGANINKSLLALGSCINALCDPRKRNHVPYRNSKLTRLLKFSLGGNCKTVMIVCVSPSSAHFDETQNTLRYANRAKNIQTKVTKNVYNVNRHVKDYVKKIDEQIALINELKQQQKEYENIAFARFRKQTEKREGVAKDGIMRIRSAYDHSATERQERTLHMRKLRQIERRIAMISSWIAAFDGVCDIREQEEAPKNLVAMKKTASGILLELESSRHHYHQRLTKANWARAVDTALQDSLRQLKETQACVEDGDFANLIKEVELMKANADREANATLLEDERGIEAALVQVLLQAHFETVAILSQIMIMDEQEAVQAARNLLGKIITACSDATSHIIKPEGGLPVTEAFPPTRTGTPKRRRGANLLGPSPLKLKLNPSLLDNSMLSSSPVKASPRRRKLGGVRKGISFSPKKRSPVKGLKRGVRWRDDTEDGTLAEFEKTPQRIDSDADTTLMDMPPPRLPNFLATSDSSHSSPIAGPPEPSLDLKPRPNRFQTGFLSKKVDGSPILSQIFTQPSSDSDHSPLREIEGNRAPSRSSLHVVERLSADIGANESAASSSGSDSEDRNWTADRIEARKIRTAMKRASMSGSSSMNANRSQRRRSPTAAVAGGSPPNENALFTASHARRMVKSERDGDPKSSVLSPRTAPIVKGSTGPRRITVGDDKLREASGMRIGAVRLSSAANGPSALSRGSMVSGSKSIWR